MILIHTDLAGVVIGGSQMVTSDHLLYTVIWHIISDEVARVSVPFFFFFSGFLFFSGLSSFSISAYWSKLKGRFHTLVVPYIFWNVVVILLFLALQILLPSLTSGAHKPILDYTFIDYLHAFWDGSDGYPICYQFWFLRDLIVTVIVSPLIYLLVRYLKMAGVLILGVAWFIGLTAMPAVSLVAFFFFAAGGWLRLFEYDFTADTMKARKWSGLLYLSILVVNTFLWHYGSGIYLYMRNCGILIGMAAVIGWTAYGLQRERIHTNDTLSGSSFFIYAYHGMLIALLGKLWVKFLPLTEGMLLLGYVLLPAIILTIGIGIYELLRHYFPRLTSVITGGR